MRYSMLGSMKIIIAISIVTISNYAIAADFYVDPAKGNMQGDGSAQKPWSTMQAVWEGNKIQTQRYAPPYDPANPTLIAKNSGAPVQPGDTIYLLSGYHGYLDIVSAINSGTVTVKAAPGANPTFKYISITSGKNWIFDGVSISPSYAPVYSKDGSLFRVADHSYTGPSSHITIKNSYIFSVEDISGWSKEDWVAKASGGGKVGGGLHYSRESYNPQRG